MTTSQFTFDQFQNFITTKSYQKIIQFIKISFSAVSQFNRVI